MSMKQASLVHSFSMFQTSLNKPDPPTSTYKPPLFTSSCGSIADESRRTSNGLPTKTRKPGSRSHSITTANQSTRRNPNRSRSIGGFAPPHRLSPSNQGINNVSQKDSLGSIVESKTSVANFGNHLSSLMSLSTQV